MITVMSETLARGRELVMLTLRILWYHLVLNVDVDIKILLSTSKF